MPQNENHISETEFMTEFFGNFGRDLGNPKQHFTDNPMEIIDFVEYNNKNKLPSFISVQPRTGHNIVLGIEKLFFDFDYGRKSDKLTPKQIEKLKGELDDEVKKFVYTLSEVRSPQLNPMIIKTNKGYHVYIYLDKVYEFSNSQEFVKQIYKTLMKSITNYGNLSTKFLDKSTDEDLVRLCRIPFSIHQVSGKKCGLLKLNNKREFEEVKLHGLELYKGKGLKYSDVVKAVKETVKRIDLESKELKTQVNTGQTSQGGGEIRPCYLKAIQGKEMEHLKRLSLLGEAWYSGIKDIDGLTNLFANMNDFDLNKTRYYVQYFLDGKNYLTYPPYRCETLKKLGYCLQNNTCPMYKDGR